MTARDQVLTAAKERGLQVTENGSTVVFGYYQVSFRENGQWWAECAHGPRLQTGRASLSRMLEILATAPDQILAPPHYFA